MKRYRSLSPSPSISATEREKTVYAVFENRVGAEYRFLIYKLHPVESAGKDGPKEFGHPIWRIKASDYPINMAVFSLGSKLYFCGGQKRYAGETGNRLWGYARDAYMLDTSNLCSSYSAEDEREMYTSKLSSVYSGPKEGLYTSKLSSSNSGDEEGMTIKLTQIQSMEYTKSHPCVFGPVDNHRYYVITDNLYEDICTFELLDTNTNEWKSLPTPPFIQSLLFDPSFKPEEVLSLEASVLCGSNICLSTLAALFVFCTNTHQWKVFGYDPDAAYDLFTREPSTLPFLGVAHSLFVQNKNEKNFLVSSFPRAGLPKVYKSPLVVKLDDFERDDVFQHSGEVEGFKEHWEEMPELIGPAGGGISINVFSLDYKSRVCIVWNGSVASKGHVIDVCDVSMMGAKVKVENSVTYKHYNNGHNYETPRHFFVA